MTSDACARYQAASVWMKRGIALLNQNDPSALDESISCFDKAIELRLTLSLADDPHFRYGLAAGWMNRGDALGRLESPDHLAEAVRSFDEALNVLSLLRLDLNPLYRTRLAIAWLNRGLVLLRQGGNLSEAARSFDESIRVLEHPEGAAIPDREQILGCAWMNHANALARMRESALPEARLSSQRALKYLAEFERANVVAAEAALKARHILCQAISEMLAHPLNRSIAGELFAEATDAADGGMQLAREWETRGITRFRDVACDLFRFGVRVYQTYQPQFLLEFILENLEPENSPCPFLSPEMRAEALRALWKEWARIPASGEQSADRLREIRSVEAQLSA